ncbi:MAG: aspartate kinase [Flavobacteriales bacterium]|nr:aspartate kinase [Flavobacteriales bacterium]
MKVFKFGGASVKDAAGVRNVANVLRHFPNDDLLIVVSAMGKTTNALEEVVWDYVAGRDAKPRVDLLREHHLAVFREVARDPRFPTALEHHFNVLYDLLKSEPSGNIDRDYDQIVSLGEIWSTIIVESSLAGNDVSWWDCRPLIRTDSKFRSANIDWEVSQAAINKLLRDDEDVLNKEGGSTGPRLIVTQGFIGRTVDGLTTTLGREGSDFSAAIFAYLLDAESVTIWKDVPGMFNADPKRFPDTKLLSHISYKEAIELSYFGASVIHPRTLQPLQRKNIPLYVRSFVDLAAPGSTIDERSESDSLIPSFIIKPGQVLLSITPRDLSFIVEENLSGIFGVFAQHGVCINLMQNSAVAFTVCMDNDNRIKPLVLDLRREYEVRWNEELELVTVRHYDEVTLEKLLKGREVLIEQRSRITARFVVK